jgi:hypothetical protein
MHGHGTYAAPHAATTGHSLRDIMREHLPLETLKKM